MSRCAWHCMDLDNDGGVCNAILYDRETKVVRIKRGKKHLNLLSGLHNGGGPTGERSNC